MQPGLPKSSHGCAGSQTSSDQSSDLRKTSRNQDPLLPLQPSLSLLSPDHPGEGDRGTAQCPGPQVTSLNGLWGDREETGSERPADQNWLSQCVFTLVWAHSPSISPSPGPEPRQLPPLSPGTQAWPGLVGAFQSYRPWDPPRSPGWLPGSLTSSVITSFTLSSKNPTQPRQPG